MGCFLKCLKGHLGLNSSARSRDPAPVQGLGGVPGPWRRPCWAVSPWSSRSFGWTTHATIHAIQTL
eukprot:8076628-Pyramimonas_sp.AAC.1